MDTSHVIVMAISTTLGAAVGMYLNHRLQVVRRAQRFSRWMRDRISK